MQKNLFQKTVYEVYKSKEKFGYKVIDAPQMFAVLWNDQTIGLNVVHCEKFTNKELNFIEKEFSNMKICVASNFKSEIISPKFKFDEVAYMMLFESSSVLKENRNFEIKIVTTQQELNLFCDIAGDVFGMHKEVEALQKSLSYDLTLSNCDKYIGYVDNHPAGILEMCRGSEAGLISWVGVKKEFRRQGLSREMLSCAINNEILKGCYKFVLVASELGQKVYSNFGFNTMSSRYDYIIKK